MPKYFLRVDWHAYAIALFYLLAMYWLLIFFFLYKKETRSLLRRAGGITHKKEFSETAGVSGPPDPVTRQGALFMEEPSGEAVEAERLELDRQRLIYKLSDEVTQYIKEAGLKKTIREEMIQGLRSMLRREIFKPVWEPRVRVLVNNLIRSETEAHCQSPLTAEEVRTIWVD